MFQKYCKLWNNYTRYWLNVLSISERTDVINTADRSTLCECGDFVDQNGYGDCQKRDIGFRNLFTCYVSASSLCKDLRNSTLHPDKQISAEACEDKNESMRSIMYLCWSQRLKVKEY